MNAGMQSLSTLVAEVERQKVLNRDFIAPLGRLSITPPTPGTKDDIWMTMQNGHATQMPIRNIAHGHLAEAAGVPKPYYDRLRTDHPLLLSNTLNTLLQEKKNPIKRKLLRTQGGELRAMLSDHFRPLDYFDLCEACIPTLLKYGVQVVSCQITESRMFIKVILPSLQADIQGVTLGKGHTMLTKNIVVAALTISDSEVGMGSVSVIPSVYDTFCTNLAQLSVRFMRKYHIGRVGVGDGDSVEELLTNETRVARDKAFFMTVKDIVTNSLSDRGFHEAINEIKIAQSDVIDNKNLPAVIEVASEYLGIGKESRSTLLTNLVQRGDLSRWGLCSAVTALANEDGMDYEVSNEYERLGGRVLELPKQDWERIVAGVSKN